MRLRGWAMTGAILMRDRRRGPLFLYAVRVLFDHGVG